MNPAAEVPPGQDGSVARARAIRAMLGWSAPEGSHAPVEAEDAALAATPAPRAGVDRVDTAPTPLTRWLPAFVMIVLVALAVTGCERTPGIVLWHAYNGAERDALAQAAARWNDAHPERPLQLVGVPFNAFADKLTSAIPNGNGPDLFIYPQDRVGGWIDSGVIEPIEFWVGDALASRFTDETVAAMAYKGSLWGLPVTVKSLALYYRTDLIDAPPRTTDELIALTARMRARGGYALAYTNVNLYGHAPWLFGFGGEVIDDAGRLAIATPEAAAAMAFARELVAKETAPSNADSPYVATLFNEGKAATAISGPWFQSDIAQGVPWKVAVLPVVSATGEHAAPFLGVDGILMSARASDKDAAFAIMDALTSDVAALERAQHARQVVPNRRANEDPAVTEDPTLRTFRDQLAHAVPMPMDAAMRMVWTPYKTALGEVIAGRGQPGAQLLGVEREIAGYLAGAP